jgi:outer membrane protein, heavy metal efflux system
VLSTSPRLIALATIFELGGCATFNPAADRIAVERLLAERGAPALGWENNQSPEGDAQIKAWRANPMTIDLAVRTAMLKSPKLQQVYGELGLARADVLDAVAVANPRISVSSLALAGGPGSQFLLGVSQPLVDLLTLPAKARLARLDYERARYELAASILGVGLDVESAWYRYVAAEQVAEMRRAVAEALDISAELAQRFYDAGNITELQLNREMAAATDARIEAARAGVNGKLARLELNTLIGLSASEADWKTETVLMLPVVDEDDPATLQRLAKSNSLELLVAHKGAEVAAGAARITKYFRLLGTTSVGYERERESDRSIIRGPTLDLELPIFNQGGARVARSEARLRIARARLTQLALAQGNAIALSAERVRVLSEVVELYRTALIPARETVTRQSQLEENFALIGQFEVLQAKAQEYGAYQGFLESVRDYWLARVDLMRLVGSRLPSEAEATVNTPSVAEIIGAPTRSSAEPALDHSMHGGHQHGNSAPDPSPPKTEPEHHHGAKP